MTGIYCSNCNHELRENESPCPKCGDTRRTFTESINMKMGSNVTVTTEIHRLRKEAQKNWPLVLVLVLINLASVIPAYFLSGLPSVLITIGCIISSTVIGYYAITRVITITIEK